MGTALGATEAWLAREARRTELRARTVAQLKVLCAQGGLRKTGAKAALVARLHQTFGTTGSTEKSAELSSLAP